MDEESYDATPEGSAKRWLAEFKAARETLSEWHKSGDECDHQYRDDIPRTGQKLNLYASGVDLKEATLYGNTPNVDVERRSNDQNDDVARVGAELLKRLLNGDLERDEEQFPRAVGFALKDWLIPGGALVWERLERETETVEAVDAITGPDGSELAPAVPESTKMTNEDVATDYVFWKGMLWSPARVWDDVRWFARQALMSKASFEKKFGDERVPYAIGADPKDATVPKTPWARVEVWEIWDKEGRCVWWYVDGHIRVLAPAGLQANKDGSLPDPLGLANFWPFPEPLYEGLTTSKLVPRPGYSRAQDLYAGIDDSYSREKTLRDAIDASCVYDKTVGELGEILNSNGQNKAVPATNYKALAEKGGLAACIAWKPLEPIIAAMDKLREVRREDIELLFQIDGTSDIMRGQATQGGVTATEQAIKAKYGSIRGGKAQTRFARFVQDAQRIRAEIVCKHFSPETIVMRSNAQALPSADQALVPQAIEMLKSKFERFRIVVKAESVSLTDYAANKQEAIDVVGMIGQFFQSVAPIVQGAPALAPKMLELLTVFIARVKGGDAAEPILDDMVKQVQVQAQQAAQAAAMPKPPDPVLQTAQVKAQAEQFKAKAGVVQTQMDMQQAQAEHAMDMQKLEAQVRADAMRTAMGPEGAQR